MGRLVRINPATEEKNSQAAVVATGAHGRLVKTGDVQRTSPAGNTVKLPSRETERADELDKRTTPSKSRQGQNRSFGERLAKMPQGLETSLYKELDENGVTVSGGEAQKIAIARALHKDAPFIVLDEPTAALDPVAEAEIYAKFNEIAGDKTAIYISHRLSSCKFCDEIAVFDHGEVVQQGTHEALLSDTNGKYCELWNAQAQYYTEETA